MLAGLPITRPSKATASPFRGNPALVRAILAYSPDLVLWHVGLTSFLRPSTAKQLPFPIVGLFTSPVYHPRELLRLGLVRLLRGWRLTAVHLLGLLVPGLLMQRAFGQGILQDLVVECETTKARLLERGLPVSRIHIIRPSIDPAWFESKPLPAERTETRQKLGYTPRDIVVGYFGPPTPLRGLPALIEAVALARQKNPVLKLLALSRLRDGELGREQRAIEVLVGHLHAEPWARIETGFLRNKQLIQTLAACDLVALPFAVVPSDVPLSVLEAMALGLPVVTTDIACLPELVPDDAGLRVPPTDIGALAAAISVLAVDLEERLRLVEAAHERARFWQASCQRGRIWDRLMTGEGRWA
jgi:glycosyltransferase involved in cell wall biosynthesis